jgi:hypothetical protein
VKEKNDRKKIRKERRRALPPKYNDKQNRKKYNTYRVSRRQSKGDRKKKKK